MNLKKQQASVRMLLAWGPSVLIGILIFYVSHIPGNEITTPKSISNLKPSVIYHIIIFTMLGFSLCHATKANSLKVFTHFKENGTYALFHMNDFDKESIDKPYFYHTEIGMVLSGTCQAEKK